MSAGVVGMAKSGAHPTHIAAADQPLRMNCHKTQLTPQEKVCALSHLPSALPVCGQRRFALEKRQLDKILDAIDIPQG